MEMQNGNGKYTMKSIQQLRAKCQRQGMSLINMNQIYCKAWQRNEIKHSKAERNQNSH
jgi:hypothetical protein